jgi:hypothetical protein
MRYRQPRFNNRRRDKGWLPPSLQHRIDTTMAWVAWVARLRRLAPVTHLAHELVRFDMQKMQNPDLRDYRSGSDHLLAPWRAARRLGRKGA